MEIRQDKLRVTEYTQIEINFANWPDETFLFYAKLLETFGADSFFRSVIFTSAR